MIEPGVNPRWRILEIRVNFPKVIQMVRHGKHVMLFSISIDKFDGAEVVSIGKKSKL